MYLHVMEAMSRKKVENPDVKKGDSKKEALVGSTNKSSAKRKPSVTIMKKSKKNHAHAHESDSEAD